MAEASVAPGANLPSVPRDDLMRRYGSLPRCISRRRWLYNSGSDILGVLIARVTDQALMTQRLWDRDFLAIHHDFWISAYQAIDD